MSDDDGETWHVKRLAGTQQHEDDDPPWGETLGYSVVRQAPNVRKVEEKYPGGKTRTAWSGGVVDDGRYLLDGTETWYWENGRLQRQAEYQLGQKSGQETYWDQDGRKLWYWQYGEDGTDVWTQYWPNGNKKTESTWRNFKCEGRATCWDMAGKVQSSVMFVDDKMVE